MKITQKVHIDNGIEISDLEYHEQGFYAGYITGFTTFNRKHVRYTVFSVSDPRRESLKLVQIEYSHLHPKARRYWQKIEQGLINICKRYGLGPAPIIKEGFKT